MCNVWPARRFAMFVHLRYAPRPRRDQQMTGASIIKCFGAFSGGAFIYWEEDDGGTPAGQLSIETAKTYDTRREMVLYDGDRCHAIAPFEGEFYSLVFSTFDNYILLAPRAKKTLVEIGAIWPDEQACAYWDSLVGPAMCARKNGRAAVQCSRAPFISIGKDAMTHVFSFIITPMTMSSLCACSCQDAAYCPNACATASLTPPRSSPLVLEQSLISSCGPTRAQ